jgi:hypothetical protein
VGASGVAALQQIDQQLDGLLETGQDAAGEPGRSHRQEEHQAACPAEQKKAVNAFLKAKALPEKISNDWYRECSTALSGLIAIPVPPRRTARRH